ncbi:DUF4292 domain-containing protein [uncultured Bacteroides sp.]|uniref:DUF4292 domain-containing protein n=1 Tax=uncultured Bacteroides sp. TaxID=162156 RepID=UPI002AAB9081|nr:DUF4292 domain-containing protein [uncultured Bacteroides sp.]
MRKAINVLSCLLLALALLTACKSSKIAVKPLTTVTPSSLSSKIQLTVPYKGDEVRMGGSMKMETDRRIQFSIQLPIIRTEVARIDMTPDEMLIVDRMNKRFVRADKVQLATIFPKGNAFVRLQRLLLKAAQPRGKSTFEGKELGLSSFLNGTRLRLYDFSTNGITLTPSKLSSKYTEVEFNDLIKLLLNL